MPNKMNQNPKKAKNFKKSMTRLFAYLKPFYKLLIAAIVLTVLSTIIRLIGPNKIAELTNIINPFKNATFELSSVWKIAILLIVLYLLGSLFMYISDFIIARVCFVLTRTFRRDISKKINNVPIKYVDKTPYGDILSVVTNDIDIIGDAMFTSTTSLVGSIVLFLGSLLMMFITNAVMTVCAILSTIFGFALLFVIIKNSQKYFVQNQKNLAELDGVIEEYYSGQTTIRTINAIGEANEKFEKHNKNLYRSVWKSSFLSGAMHPVMAFSGNLGYVVVCIVGAIMYFQGKIELGVISSFMIYIRLFTNPLSQIAQSMANLQTTAAASERIFGFLDSEELSDESDKNVELPKIQGNVSIQNVKFGYDSSREIIHDFSAEIKAGQKIAIVGPTGAGKTTIVNLLMRFYEINSGKILIDGISIQDMTRTQLRTIFSMVLQDTWLFEGTIRENLIYNMTGITDEDLDRVCEACGLSHFIKTLPSGYDTVLSDETNVSVGQKQLLTIARAMLQDSPMLILDEATSNVDTRTEVLIQQAMDKLTENRTSFVIAHRLSTIKNADLILVLKDGDVIESGNHDQLIESKGFYYELYNSQFSFEGCDLID